MVNSSSKPKPEPVPNPSTSGAYDFTAISSALGQVDDSLAPSAAAFDMTGLSAALGEPDHLERIVRLARVHEKLWKSMDLKRPHATRIITNPPPFKVKFGRGRRSRDPWKRRPIRTDCEELDRTFKSLMNDRNQNQKFQD